MDSSKGTNQMFPGQITIEDILIASQNPYKKKLMINCQLMGLLGFFLFMWKRNYDAMVSCIVLVLLLFVSLYMNHCFCKQILKEEIGLKIIKYMRIIMFFGFLAVWVLGNHYVHLAVSENKGFHFENNYYYVAAVPTFLTSVWAFILLKDCGLYQFICERKIVPVQFNQEFKNWIMELSKQEPVRILKRKPN